MLSCDIAESLCIAGTPPDMYANNACCARGNHALHLLWIKIMGLRVNITKNRSDLLPLESMRGGDEGKRRDDNLPFHTQGANCDFQRHGGITNRDAMFHTRKLF